jgi:transposase
MDKSIPERHAMYPALELRAADLIDTLLPAKKRGRKRLPTVEVLRAALWIIAAGCPWRDLPAGCGHWRTVCGRFREWVDKGILEMITGLFDGSHVVAASECSVDSTVSRANAGALGAPPGQAIGSGRGGPGTKTHAIVDDSGVPVALCCTGAQASDVSTAEALIGRVALLGGFVNADKAYVSRKFVEKTAQSGGALNAPPKSGMGPDWEYDSEIYKERRKVENFFCKIKQFRRIATRYEKLVSVFKGVIILACLKIFGESIIRVSF